MYFVPRKARTPKEATKPREILAARPHRGEALRGSRIAQDATAAGADEI
jgi:hypothetical protein